MQAQPVDLKEAVLQQMEDLPTERIAEVLDFVLFLKQREQDRSRQPERVVKSIPASELRPLVGLVSLGGDAVVDSERLYSDD